MYVACVCAQHGMVFMSVGMYVCSVHGGICMGEEGVYTVHPCSALPYMSPTCITITITSYYHHHHHLPSPPPPTAIIITIIITITSSHHHHLLLPSSSPSPPPITITITSTTCITAHLWYDGIVHDALSHNTEGGSFHWRVSYVIWIVVAWK